MDFGTLPPPGGLILPGTDVSSLTDNINTFILGKSSFDLTQIDGNSNVDVSVQLHGLFQDVVGGTQTKGTGDLTFQIAGNRIQTLRGLGFTGDDITVVTSALAAGQSIGDLSFSGALFTTVPEPATLLGLGIVAAGMAVSRRRNKTIPS
ncbi:PEP-CTERM sorting domain-containing protein [Nostoc sp. CCY0012]|uniref:PEP-CTERM sorting domain-containing protein n=1 Tax=Nostoc sp. CCY0012 TaxID=1056123 RepID=UPI0039C65B93